MLGPWAKSPEKGHAMISEIEIERLVKFETAADGNAVKLIVRDVANRTFSIILTVETLSSLLMTLPAMALSAVKRAHKLAIVPGWPWKHESGTYVKLTQAGADLFADPANPSSDTVSCSS
jgi:hypothetical protein